MPSSQPVIETSFTDLHLIQRGKVRDIYEIAQMLLYEADTESLLLVATDRISAFDCVIPTPIPHKGEVLTQISRFWFEKLSEIGIYHHLITTEIEKMPQSMQKYKKLLHGRSMLVRKTEVFPVECVVRGYLSGSGWKDYLQTGEVCGHRLPENLLESAKLPEPIFTPATKAASGHDENISETRMAEIIGFEITQKLKDLTLAIYQFASNYARQHGIIIADTKFEFGLDERGKILLIDEVLTPDSSRFWSVEKYEVGKSQPSFDKQPVRDYLETLEWDKQPPAPPLPAGIVNATTERYLTAYKLLTGEDLRF